MKKTAVRHHSGVGPAIARLMLATLLVCPLTTSAVQGPSTPLKPPDRSSPSATLQTFLRACDALGAFLAQEYLPAPTHDNYDQLLALGNDAVQCLDLSEVPPASQAKGGGAAAVALYETLSRIPLPALGEIPNPEELTSLGGTNVLRWTIPDTEIAFEQVPSGPLRGEFLFSSDTVIRTMLQVRYETTAEQLRFLLVQIRELLLGHPRVYREGLRVRFVGFGASSLDIEVFAYVKTRYWLEFLGIREDLFLRIMEIVDQSGSGFAFPSQTLYFGRDEGLDAAKAQAAEAQVRAWRDEQRLPFPDFSAERLRELRGTVAFPPPGSGGSYPPERGKPQSSAPK